MQFKQMFVTAVCVLFLLKGNECHTINNTIFPKVYMTDLFLFARLNLPNVLISIAKKFFDSDFPSLCFDVPKVSNFTSGGVQNRTTKNRGLGTIVTSIQDSKPREKQISDVFLFSHKQRTVVPFLSKLIRSQ